MTVLNFPKAIRAAAVALVLGGTAFSAMPAQAQPSVEFRFGGPGFGFQFDTRRHGGRWCMENREVRRDLQRSGYRDIRFFDRRGRVISLYAERRGTAYRIVYDTCRGEIIDRDRIRRR